MSISSRFQSSPLPKQAQEAHRRHDVVSDVVVSDDVVLDDGVSQDVVLDDGVLQEPDSLPEAQPARSTWNEPGYEVVWPLSRKAVAPQEAAPRLESLEGATIAFVWDYMFRGEELFPAIAEKLVERHPGIKIVGWSEFGNIHGPDEVDVVNALPHKLKRFAVDAAICAVGC